MRAVRSECGTHFNFPRKKDWIQFTVPRRERERNKKERRRQRCHICISIYLSICLFVSDILASISSTRLSTLLLFYFFLYIHTLQFREKGHRWLWRANRRGVTYWSGVGMSWSFSKSRISRGPSSGVEKQCSVFLPIYCTSLLRRTKCALSDSRCDQHFVSAHENTDIIFLCTFAAVSFVSVRFPSATWPTFFFFLSFHLPTAK